MLEWLRWLYGPAADSNPHFQLLSDFIAIMPWWYPYFWLCIGGAYILFRSVGRLRQRRLRRQGLDRLRGRFTQQAAESPPVRRFLSDEDAANDNYPALLLERKAGN